VQKTIFIYRVFLKFFLKFFYWRLQTGLNKDVNDFSQTADSFKYSVIYRSGS